ncbi:MAG: hypothetical protein M0R32_08445 [Candidatus Cloacimonetes bacterium]|nr:hypothetical protein [Candidatus Cloacimonadota bacterium]
MTNEQIFKERYPKASIEAQKTNGPLGKTYYLVRAHRNDYMYRGSGDTKAEAWSDAVASFERERKVDENYDQ